MPVLEDLGDKKGTNSHLKKRRDNLTHSTKCVSPKERARRTRREWRDEPRRAAGCEGRAALGRAGARGLPLEPQSRVGTAIPAHPAPPDGADPAGRVLAKADGRYGTGTLRDLCYAH